MFCRLTAADRVAKKEFEEFKELQEFKERCQAAGGQGVSQAGDREILQIISWVFTRDPLTRGSASQRFLLELL